MKKIEVGDRVALIDDVLSGIVIDIKGSQLQIETDDGFTMEVAKDEVVVDEGLSLNRAQLTEALFLKKEGVKKKTKSSKKRPKEKPMEVDLHIEELVPSTKNMSDFDMLNLQIDTARRQLEFAIQRHIRRVVFIHGVGKGVLRAELETLFRRYEGVEYYDADFQQYGRGATEVYIYQNF